MQAKRVARIVVEAVSGILAPGPARLAQIIRQFGFAQAQQRPVEVAGERPHARQAPGARAPRQVHQHRLGLVVHVVGERDAVAAGLLPEPAQRLIPQPARLGFQTRAVCSGGCGDIRAGAQKGNIQIRAQRPAEFGVLGAVGPDAVIHVGREQRQAVFRPRFGQQAGQRHGIRAAGQRDQDSPAAHGGEIRFQRPVPAHETSLHDSPYHYNRFMKI